METLGIIMVCMSALAEHCQVLTSPHVYNTVEECREDAYNTSLSIKQQYPHATILPQCVELNYKGEKA